MASRSPDALPAGDKTIDCLIGGPKLAARGAGGLIERIGRRAELIA